MECMRKLTENAINNTCLKICTLVIGEFGESGHCLTTRGQCGMCNSFSKIGHYGLQLGHGKVNKVIMLLIVDIT